MVTGFYFCTPTKEYFFVTNITKRTDKLCKDVENYLIKDGCKFVKDGKYHGLYADFSIHDKLEPATCEIKHLEKFGYYCYDIKGDNFSGAGGFINDCKTEIVLL